MAARTTFSKSMALGTTALAALGLTACSDSEGGGGFATAAEFFEAFDVPVGEPVAVISATRGGGDPSVDFDQFTVTFENSEGTEITIGTPEGEEIFFALEDPATWVGEDEDIGGINGRGGLELARLVSEDGDRLEVFIGEVEVPVAPEPDVESGNQEAVRVGSRCYSDDCYGTEDQVVLASARLDENDTRDGFETYAVTGLVTNVDDLPRHSGLDEVLKENDEGELVCVANCEGTLIEGQAYYYGYFLGSVFKDGEIVSDTAYGSANVNIDFANNEVQFDVEGSYEFDDIDDDRNGVVTGVQLIFETIEGVDVVAGVVPTYGDTSSGEFVTNVTPEFSLIGQGLVQVVTDLTVTKDTIGGDSVVTDIDLNFANVGGHQAAVGVSLNTISDNDDRYGVSLYGQGDGDDIDFNNGVTYHGELSGNVEIPVKYGSYEVDVNGEFGGAVFGPGESAFDVLDTDDEEYMASPYEIVGATGTAGVFDAASETENGLDPNVEIVGGFTATDSEFGYGE